ncbi:hypothetical protein H0H92_012125 [Tricholoma furcatifolium]|nr:hypothetical protein H0H92_012125 [Tricholoma furcatifolium]
MYVLPPHLANGDTSYAELYADILAAYRSSPMTSASSVIILVAADVDALCAARMLSTLLHHDDIIYRIIPTPGYTELIHAVEEAVQNLELRTVIMINLGGFLDLATDSWFGNAGSRLKIHVIDSLQPKNLANYWEAPDVYVWDDGNVQALEELRKSFDITFVAPEHESDSEDSDGFNDEDEESENNPEEDEEEYAETDSATGKRRSLGRADKPTKRRKTSREACGTISREEYRAHQEIVDAYYRVGTSYGQSASAAIYILATVLERVDNDLLWLAILGLTYQYTTSRISRDYYDTQQSIYDDEVSRLNPLPSDGGALASLKPDDISVRASDELRFMLFRHWTLYDAMLHSSYIASKLGIWKDRGRKRLTGLLAKIGFSISQSQQSYAHMDMDLKRDLVQKLNDVAPEYGLVELSYPSFMRCFGYRSQPLSAADAVEGISALLDVANGVKIDVEIEGARNGGEWFGGGRAWEANIGKESARKRREEDGAEPQEQQMNPNATNGKQQNTEKEDSDLKPAHSLWVKNFWTAYDALKDIDALRDSLRLSMALHRAIIRQGTSIIDKQDIKTMQGYRIVILSQGPDLALFTLPSVLSRLALWLVDALRDRLPPATTGPKGRRKSLPIVVACSNDTADTYMIVGVTAALEFGDVRKKHVSFHFIILVAESNQMSFHSDFSRTFMQAKNACHIEAQHTSFDVSVLEIPKQDLKIFLEALCEGPES